jgi:hypothetical protein
LIVFLRTGFGGSQLEASGQIEVAGTTPGLAKKNFRLLLNGIHMTIQKHGGHATPHVEGTRCPLATLADRGQESSRPSADPHAQSTLTELGRVGVSRSSIFQKDWTERNPGRFTFRTLLGF